MISVPPPPEERLGTRLEGKYDLLRVCGQGGMGVVLEGVHAWTGRRVAVKLLHSPGASDSGHLERLLREARTATSLRHPNVVDVLDMGRDGESPFIVMEYLEGESMDALLSTEGRLSPERALELLLPVLGALALAHDLGIVHRDIKPANIFLSRGAGGAIVPKLLDFGIAQSVSLVPAATRDQVTGTPAYMSPEHARGKGVGPEADVWAMGVVLYRCLSGELPFSGATPQEVLEEVVGGRQRALTSLIPELPARFAAAIERALSADPAARYPDMRSFALALLTTSSSAGITLPPGLNLVGLPAGSGLAPDATGPRQPSTPAPASSSSALGSAPSGATDTYQAGPALVDSASSMALERTATPSHRTGRRRAALALLALVAAILGATRLLLRDDSTAGPPASVPFSEARPRPAAPSPRAGARPEPLFAGNPVPGASFPPAAPRPSADARKPPARPTRPAPARPAGPEARPLVAPAPLPSSSAVEPETLSVPDIIKEW